MNENWQPITFSPVEHLIMFGGTRTACGYGVTTRKFRLDHWTYKKCKICVRSLARMELDNPPQREKESK